MSGRKVVVRVLQAGRLDYRHGLQVQRLLFSRHHKTAQQQQHETNSLILCEHDPVYTVGIRDASYGATEETKLRRLGADFQRTNRGGLVTFHGPGQLVAYPIIDLRALGTGGVKAYVDRVERLTIRVCAELGVKAQRLAPHTGVWAVDNASDPRKICAIGIHASRYVTTHGLALNCNTDLGWFQHIVPCGIEGKEVTSLSREVGANVAIEDALPYLVRAFADEFNCETQDFSVGEISEILTTARRQLLQSS